MSRRAGGRRMLGAGAATVLVATIMVAFGSTTTASADDGGTSGITITVTVGGTGAPSQGSPGGSGVPRSSTSGSGTGSSGSGAGSAAASGTTTTTPTTPTDLASAFNLGGVALISGVTSDYGWSINPLGGTSNARFTVRNVSTSTFDSTASFSIDGPFGNELSRVDNVAITGLKPGESRVVDATLSGLGQFTFFTTHATFTPPASVGGTELTPITRDGFLFVVPWLIVLLGLIGAGIYALARRLNRGAEGLPGSPLATGSPGLTPGLA